MKGVTKVSYRIATRRRVDPLAIVGAALLSIATQTIANVVAAMIHH